MKEYTNQQLLDICDNMPEDQKKCGVTTLEDGSGTVDLADFIVNYGRALLTEFNKEDETKVSS
jgi:hypothetical protein